MTRARTGSGRPYPRRVLRVAVGIVGYAAVAALFLPFTWPALLATVLPLVVAGGYALRRPARPLAPAPSWRRIAPWAVVLAAGIGWELMALFRSPRADYPTISSIVSPLAAGQWWFRFLGYLLWLAAGTALVRRWA